ncbi:MAG: hypothetical protein ISS34_01880 [Candidatus Omnitrophica bacterium]|nr:hypothetical protein [Candidatus Omnitrophota bacterium]
MTTVKKSLLFFFICLFTVFLGACSEEPMGTTVLKHYPINSMEGVITRSRVEFDEEITADGDGSLRITVSKPFRVRLYETGDIDVKNARLIYQAKLRTEDVEGKVYIQMWCHFPGKGEYYSRAIQSALSGTNEWTSQEIPFFLTKKDNPDNIKFDVVLTGKGTVWVDDIKLIRAPLR